MIASSTALARSSGSLTQVEHLLEGSLFRIKAAQDPGYPGDGLPSKITPSARPTLILSVARPGANSTSSPIRECDMASPWQFREPPSGKIIQRKSLLRIQGVRNLQPIGSRKLNLLVAGVLRTGGTLDHPHRPTATRSDVARRIDGARPALWRYTTIRAQFGGTSRVGWYFRTVIRKSAPWQFHRLAR